MEDIYVYSVEQFGIDQTDYYFQGIQEQFEHLQMYPELGQGFSSVMPTYRRLAYQSHIIYYKVLDEKILITRLLHSKQDPASSLSDFPTVKC
ncbi:MAG: hypothetical protein COZ36_10530 [Piscirickettsiaceae bacterium CG_4_10_14_3_um_filter_44_349]|nr:type II toxin-antitoxin system RelE/ParE family toxin [Thiomicrospira sp.]PIQ04389.1 MAG: hypothetical protein COW74_05190 [Piscirickettsiaceae bacterium CG18_big_fil_WC_8_21_14_2_50_44_103]PIU37804.1 MAG: hypothetical protein COT01_09975 [Piscirickettsiaceae bacterium CG07_land_8_20_14_0_80_44_28]PIW57401.1 MAG: hypothetical protein COW14_06165 [Piscirickettsiaceae bacterium CG12_big_fil_rev_8_21_14_0_65_44_934]PIW76839.1 MAG: hypothetical protein CO000_10020 [Piscirickettsiaceae bacterium 